MFMKANAATSDLPPATGPATQDRPSRFGHLISLVRRIVDYGRQLAATLQHPTPAANLDEIARTFGSYDFRQILAAITRGLHRAAALQARLARLESSAAPPEPGPAVPSPRVLRDPASAAPRTKRPTRPALAFTPQEIQAHVRRRPIGRVFADLCRDFGITPGHPLWDEVKRVIMEYDGGLSRLWKDIQNCPWLNAATRQPIPMTLPNIRPLFYPDPTLAGTGPPQPAT